MKATIEKIFRLARDPNARREHDSLHGEGEAYRMVANSIGKEHVLYNPINWEDLYAVEKALIKYKAQQFEILAAKTHHFGLVLLGKPDSIRDYRRGWIVLRNRTRSPSGTISFTSETVSAHEAECRVDEMIDELMHLKSKISEVFELPSEDIG